MKLVFIDEVEQPHAKEGSFGIGALIIDSAKYGKLKQCVKRGLEELHWPDSIEFKGRYAFSQSGEKEVSVDGRINFLEKVFAESRSNHNARYTFHLLYNFDGQNKENYKFLLGELLKTIPNSTSRKGDKNITGIFLDKTDCLTIDEVSEIAINNLKKGLVIVERPFFVQSSNGTQGILTVDFLCYLKLYVECYKKSTDIPQHVKKKIDTINNILKNVSVKQLYKRLPNKD